MLKPVILLVTGAWHLPIHYSKVSSRLRHLGYTVECPGLLTNNDDMPPTKTLDDDIAQVRNIALGHLENGRDIVALMHSYGGMVGTSAFSGLGATDRGNQSCVKALIYMAAFIPFEEESLAGIFGGALPPFLVPDAQGTIGIIEPGPRFYNDLTAEEQVKWTSHLVCHPTVAQFQPVSVPVPSAWRKVPITYLFCSGDQALPVQVQEMMVNRIEQAETRLRVDRAHCTAGHSPFLSMPEQVIQVVERVCQVPASMQDDIIGLEFEQAS